MFLFFRNVKNINGGILIMYDRLFKLWYYTISHRQMLLRGRNNNDNGNLDICFFDVEYIEMPIEMDKIEILSVTQEDRDYIKQKFGDTDKLITVLMSQNRKYYVVSSVIKIMENNLSMFELPFDIPCDMGDIYG